MDSFERRSRREARRARRQAQIYSQIQEAVQDVNDLFLNRHADLWNINSKEDRGATRRIRGHAGAAAAAYVGETFGQYDIRGQVKTAYAGMTREAGTGGHGISDGTIHIEVQVTPLRGMAQVFDVPVRVENGYMLQPGLMYHQGSPMVISQSAIDEMLELTDYGAELKLDRRNMYSPPNLKVRAESFARELEKTPTMRTAAQEERPVGTIRRVACDLNVTLDDSSWTVPADARVVVVAHQDDGLTLVRDQYWNEFLVDPSHLS